MRREYFFEKFTTMYCKVLKTFYIFAKLPVDNAEKFAKWLLTDYSYEKKTILIAPGPGFYNTDGKGEQEVRFSFCTNADDIENAMIVLRRALEEYNKK